MFKIETEHCDLKTKLINAIETRETTIFKCPAMKCAMFLDRRYANIQPASDLLEAKQILSQIWIKLQLFQPRQEPDKLNTSDETMKSFVLDNAVRDVDHRHACTNIIECLEAFMKSPTEPMNSPSLVQWERNKHKYPEIYQIACVINSIAPSQCSVERSFSSLKIVLNEKRTRLLQTNVENIICCKLNSSVLYNIFEKDCLKVLHESND